MSQQPYDRLHSLSQPGHILSVAELRHEHKQERAVHIFERGSIVVDDRDRVLPAVGAVVRGVDRRAREGHQPPRL